jgi:[ribosomal protein S18]-alanine N-acetyltransferase
MKTRVHIRWMIRRDLAEILMIEKSSFAGPCWREEDFLNALRQRNMIGLVTELEDRVVGFVVYEISATTIKVLNLAVATDLRRQSVGRQFVEKLVGKLSPNRRTRLTAQVRETSLEAQLLLRACGLKAKRIVRAAFPDTGEDGYLFAVAIPKAKPQETAT